ncbi:MAG: CBS domain-containing protein [Thaumarchaeota archaeon]|nr:CBS domain-containing protein [Nitrososphaerota archaeon]
MLFVKDIMTRGIKSIGQDKTITEAAKTMTKFNVGSLIVVDAKDRPMGMVTEGDISRAVGKGTNLDKTTLKAIISKKLITSALSTRVEDAARLMAESNVKKLPIVDEGGKLVGIVTQTDIVASSFDLVNSLKEMVRARYRPPDFQP